MKFRRQRDTDLQVNLTPLIDVVFLLLIFFMVTTTFTRESHLDIDLPQAVSSSGDTIESRVEVLVDASGQIYIDGQAVLRSDQEGIRRGLQAVANEKIIREVVITADSASPYQSLVGVIDAAKQLGLERVVLATQELDN